MKKFRSSKPWQKGPLPFRMVILISFSFFLFTSAIGLWFMDRQIRPILVSYAEIQTKKIGSVVVSKAIQKSHIQKDINDVLNVENGFVSFNMKEIQNSQKDIETVIQNSMNKASAGDLRSVNEVDTTIKNDSNNGITFSVPLGLVTKNVFLSNVGPRIPISFKSLGFANSEVKYKVTDSGINNAFLTVYLHITVNTQVILPFASKTTTFNKDIPIAAGYVRGEVPQFFNGGKNGTSPSIQLPDSTSGNN